MRYLIAAYIVLATAGVARADLRTLASPGPLAMAHAKFERACDKCHEPFKGIPAEKCLACHAGTAERIKSGKGTHAGWAAAGKKCTECHKDHRGRDFKLSPELDRGFDHTVTGFALDGRHKTAACAQCHQGNKWVGQPRTCVGCHGDPKHKGALGDNCTTCHSPAGGWKSLRKTLAAHALPMTGKHATATCEQCHKGGSNLKSTSQCGDCHDQTHGGTKAPCAQCHHPTSWKEAGFLHDFCTCILPGKHQTAKCLECHPNFKFNPTPLKCAGCHLKDRKHEDLGPCARCHSALSWKKKVFDHDKQVPQFPIDGRHHEVGCENCHKTAGIFTGAPTQCAGCHKTPAGHGDFGACAQCHTTAGFKPSQFVHDEKTRFKLTGPHAKVQCETCHARFKKGTYQPGPSECALCHGDPHKGQFGATDTKLGSLPPPRAHAKLAPSADASSAHGGQSECLKCHTRDRWSPSTVTVADHDRFRFPLVGTHRDKSCTLCHAGGKDAQFVGTPTECAKCHFDAHDGKFGKDCAKCHDVTEFSKVPRFDHGKATGFVLVGAHAERHCADCHGEAGDKLDKVARPVVCASCHQSRVHGAQFGARCDECHRPTKFSDVAAFDHRARTHFPLERRHAAMSCLGCHDARVRGAARPAAECFTCHGDPHRGSTGQQCELCHRADRWTLIRFDHDRSEFPLRGRHFIAPCIRCHSNNQFIGVRTECVVCHGADRQRAEASGRHPPTAPFACQECHNAVSWRPTR